MDFHIYQEWIIVGSSNYFVHKRFESGLVNIPVAEELFDEFCTGRAYVEVKIDRRKANTDHLRNSLPYKSRHFNEIHIEFRYSSFSAICYMHTGDICPQ
jgi:hypothetical protein